MAKNTVTDTIKADVTQTANKTIVEYTIIQVFNTNDRRGIFLALPLVSDGVKINYNLVSVTKNDKSEPYQILTDMFDYRFRIGNPDKTLDIGVYTYKIKLEGSYQSDNQFGYPILNGWNNDISNFEVTINNNLQKTDKNNNSYFIPTNIDKAKLSSIVQIYNMYDMQLIISIITLLIAILGYFSFKIHPMTSEYSYTIAELEPPKELLPWQGFYLINDGNLPLKDTIITYYLYLHNKGYITLNTNNTSENIYFTLNKELPNFLPSFFNDIVKQSQDKSFNSVFETLKITDSNQTILIEHVKKEVKQYYDKLPSNNPFDFILMLYLISYCIIMLIWFSFIESVFLITPSWLWFSLTLGLFFTPWVYKIISNRERFSETGRNMFRLSKGFYNYINIAEKDKLDFDNNPVEGTKYYLDNVSWASQFGLLKKFNTLAGNINIPQDTVKSFDAVSNSVIASTFYVDPSNSNGSGGSGGGFSGGGGSW